MRKAPPGRIIRTPDHSELLEDGKRFWKGERGKRNAALQPQRQGAFTVDQTDPDSTVGKRSLNASRHLLQPYGR